MFWKQDVQKEEKDYVRKNYNTKLKSNNYFKNGWLLLVS